MRKSACLSVRYAHRHNMLIGMRNPLTTCLILYGQTPLILKRDQCPAMRHKKGVEGT